MQLTTVDIANIQSEMGRVIDDAIQARRPQIIAAKIRQRAELAAVSRRRALSPDMSNYVTNLDDRPMDRPPLPASWEKLAGDKKALERRISGIFDSQVLPKLTAEVQRERAEGKQSSLSAKYQRAKEDFMDPAPIASRERYAKQAANNVLAARADGKSLDFKTEYNRLAGVSEPSPIVAHKPLPGRRHRACVIARQRETELRQRGIFSDLEKLADAAEAELGVAEGVMRYAKSSRADDLAAAASKSAMEFVLSERADGRSVSFRDALKAARQHAGLK